MALAIMAAVMIAGAKMTANMIIGVKMAVTLITGAKMALSMIIGAKMAGTMIIWAQMAGTIFWGQDGRRDHDCQGQYGRGHDYGDRDCCHIDLENCLA